MWVLPAYNVVDNGAFSISLDERTWLDRYGDFAIRCIAGLRACFQQGGTASVISTVDALRAIPSAWLDVWATCLDISTVDSGFAHWGVRNLQRIAARQMSSFPCALCTMDDMRGGILFSKPFYTLLRPAAVVMVFQPSESHVPVAHPIIEPFVTRLADSNPFPKAHILEFAAHFRYE